MNATELRTAWDSWASAQTADIARRAIDRGTVDFETGVFVDHCRTLARREGLSLSRVVWEYAAGVR